MKVFEINTVYDTGSTGHIVAALKRAVEAEGGSCVAAYGRGLSREKNTYRVGSDPEMYLHAFFSRLTDRTAFYSRWGTRGLIRRIREFEPDVIHLHNLHGYYLNIELLFDFLKEYGKPVLWTLHDCWPFTGHCPYFTYVHCEKWKNGCENCVQKSQYPASWLRDGSRWNYARKKEIFTGVPELTLVTPSRWLADLLKESFLKEYPVRVIPNGIDIGKFRPGAGSASAGSTAAWLSSAGSASAGSAVAGPSLEGSVSAGSAVAGPSPVGSVSAGASAAGSFRARYGLEHKFVLLGVANLWTERRKGLADFLKLAERLDDSFRLVLVGSFGKESALRSALASEELPGRESASRSTLATGELPGRESAPRSALAPGELPGKESASHSALISGELPGKESALRSALAPGELPGRESASRSALAPGELPGKESALRSALAPKKSPGKGGISWPDKVIRIPRTESAEELAEIYGTADLFLNLTYEDNYPTVNLEALACGTPVLTYASGGSPESVTGLGYVVEPGNLEAVVDCIMDARIHPDKFSALRGAESGEGVRDQEGVPAPGSGVDRRIWDEKRAVSEYLELMKAVTGKGD